MKIDAAEAYDEELPWQGRGASTGDSRNTKGLHLNGVTVDGIDAVDGSVKSEAKYLPGKCCAAAHHRHRRDEATAMQSSERKRAGRSLSCSSVLLLTIKSYTYSLELPFWPSIQEQYTPAGP